MKRKLKLAVLVALGGVAGAVVGSAAAQAPQPSDAAPAELEREFIPSPDAGTQDSTGGSGDAGFPSPEPVEL